MTSPLYASVNGARTTEFALSVPYYGAAVADVKLASGGALTSPVTLQIGNTSRIMALSRPPVTFAGVTTAQLVSGFAGWQKRVTLAPYKRATGVLMSLVLSDLAAACGEKVLIASDRSLGTLYVPGRPAPAGRLLRRLAGSLWWIDDAGTTRVGPRPSSKIRSAAQIQEYIGGQAWLEVATEDLAAWVPGATYTSPTVPGGVTIAAVRMASGEDGVVRLEVLALDLPSATSDPGQPTPDDRTMTALRSLIANETSPTAYHGRYRYSVAPTSTADSLDLAPVNASIAPPLPRGVPFCPSLAGSSCVPKPGTVAHVQFADGDASLPFVVGFEAGQVPTSVTLAASAVNLGDAFARLVREGDSYTHGTAAGPIVYISTADTNGASAVKG